MRAILVFGFGLLAACSPYNPNLGGEPFLCGSGAPACPSGYSCTGMSGSGMQMICEPNGKGVDANPLGAMCNNDQSLGNNHTVADAYMLPNPLPTQMSGMESIMLGSLSICPIGDQDYFQIVINGAMDGTMQTLEADVAYDTWGSALTGYLLNSGGTQIKSLMPVSGMPRTISAVAASLPPDTYYIEVLSTAAAPQMNNYTLTVTVSPYP